MAGYDRESALPKEKLKLWIQSRMKPKPETEAHIRKQFLKDLNAYKEGKYENWQYSHEGRLALILLLD